MVFYLFPSINSRQLFYLVNSDLSLRPSTPHWRNIRRVNILPAPTQVEVDHSNMEQHEMKAVAETDIETSANKCLSPAASDANRQHHDDTSGQAQIKVRCFTISYGLNTMG